MYNVSDEFLRQPLQSHVMLARVLVLDAGQVVRTLEGVVGGQVSASSGDAINRDFKVELLITDDFSIKDADDLLQPAGTEIRPEIGFEIGGEGEYVPQGVFEIESYSAADSDSGIVISVSGYDRAFTAQRPALQPYSLVGGTNGTIALKALIASIAPLAGFVGDTPWTAPSLFFPADTDRWAEAQKLAKSFGADLGFDLNGDASLADVVDLTTASPVWSFREGEESCTFTGISKEVQTDHLRTGVIVIGTHSSLQAEVRGEAWDLRPDSATYRYGPLGERPLRIYSELPLSVGQAQAMALSHLASVLAGSDMVSFTAPINPALDLYDLIDVVWPRCRINGRYMIDSIETPMDGDQMAVKASRGSLV